MSEETRSAAVSKLLEGAMDLLLQMREGSGVTSELFRSAFLLIGERGLQIHQGLLQSRDLFAGQGQRTLS